MLSRAQVAQPVLTGGQSSSSCSRLQEKPSSGSSVSVGGGEQQQLIPGSLGERKTSGIPGQGIALPRRSRAAPC